MNINKNFEYIIQKEFFQKEEILNARTHFKILPEPKGHLMSYGEFTFEFITNEGENYQIEYLVLLVLLLQYLHKFLQTNHR